MTKYAQIYWDISDVRRQAAIHGISVTDSEARRILLQIETRLGGEIIALGNDIITEALYEYDKERVHNGHRSTCTVWKTGAWSCHRNPKDPDNSWICDECGGVIHTVVCNDY